MARKPKDSLMFFLEHIHLQGQGTTSVRDFCAREAADFKIVLIV